MIPPESQDSATPILTVAIPVFNRERELVRMLDSIDAQDWSVMEVRLGDDGSTDGTLGVLEVFATKHPGKVFIDSHENMGPGPCRNRLLDQAAGEWIWFCDSDDELAPGAVARITEILRRSPSDVLAFLYGRGPCPRTEEETLLALPDVPVTRSQLLLFVLGANVAKVLRVGLLRDNRISYRACLIGEDWIFTAEAVSRCDTALVWEARPYWVCNGFWNESGEQHLTGCIDDAYCDAATRALRVLADIQDRHPAERMEFAVYRWYLAFFLRDRIRDKALPDIRDKWLPVAEGLLHDITDAVDNPLLRFPKSIMELSAALKTLARERRLALKRERAALRRERAALRREHAALRRERAALRREHAALRREKSMKDSLSWHLTMPLRAVGRLVSLLRRSFPDKT